ncbi:hypothetical protein SAMD00023353_1500780 [Rosellinia necatrix]|uniref:Uncharacterized protein n=1 Tax=Rosellinia necatrix TaxID=77044 RepID=A0A1S8A794_ROSNE|nr:hypothetical protein SAMD00023353_1500780 [Rosellinia necatrix]
MHNHATDTPVDRTVKISDEKDLTNLEHPQQPFDFAFSPKHKRVNTEPSPEIAPRGRQPRPRKVEIQEPDLEQEAPVLRPSGARRVQIEVPQMSTRDSVMARVAAQERQSQTARISRQYRQAAVGNDRALDTTEDGQDGGVELNGKLASLPNRKGEVHRSGKAHNLTASAPSSDRPNETEGKLTPDPQKNNTLEVGDRDLTEDDEVSVGTHASTIRPVSRSHDSEPMDNKKQQNSSVSRGSEPRAYATELETREGKPDFVTEMSVDDLITFDTDVPDTLQHPLQPQREMDYFASFCDSYLPPVLDLQSPGTGNRPSPRFPFSEESDEDNGHSVYRDYMQDDYTGQMNIVEEKQKAGRANGPRPKGIGKFSNEQKSKNSPATATQNSDSDVPVFERLSVPSTAAKTSTGGEMAGTSTAHPQQTDPSRTTSERSSSSTCDDSPPSPSSATTLDSSRPQSRKGTATFQTETSRVTILEPTPRTDSRASRRGVNSTLSDRAEGAATQGLGLDADVSVGGWSEVTTKSNAEQQPTPTLAKTGAFALNPSVDATPTSVNFADALIHGLEKEDEQNINQHPGRSLPPRTQSALDLHSTTKLMSRPLRPQRLHLKPNDVTSSVSLPNSPPLSDFVEEVMPRKSALKMSRNNSTAGHESSTTVSMGAAYLQEARKTAPIASASSSRALRPHFSQKHSSGSVGSAMSAGNRAEPLAKMLVECCNCHFFHDMPSRVYECMAKPDSVVEDKLLGVSAAITTMVRCPWCAHGMTTQCCSGYAAVVYLKEKLH